MIPIAYWVVLAGLLGLAIGSFLNVVIARVPAGESIVSPPSKCPRCQQPIRNRHNVPVIGWLVLHGRCADCGLPISPRYPLVEAGTGIGFAAVTLVLLATDRGAALAAALVALVFVIVLGAIAVDGLPGPRVLVVPGYVAVAVLLLVAAIATRHYLALAGAAVGAAVFAAPFVRGLPRAVPAAVLAGAAVGYLVIPLG